VLSCEWVLEAWADVPMAPDLRGRWAVMMAQPMALLRAGVVDVGQYGLFEEAPVNLDAHPAQVRLEPVPINLRSAFGGTFTVETPEPIEVQEVRLELRVQVQVSVPGGHAEEITVGHGQLEAPGNRFGGPFATHSFRGEVSDAWLPTIDLPHGRARGESHVILARAWAPDIHYVRDVALATTDQL
jgi:hypothetical protein